MLAEGAFCKPSERNYSPIKGEVTAIFNGLQDTNYYTLGCKSLCDATDHQPLVTTLGKLLVADVPKKRLARVKEKIMSWKVNMIYNPGKMQNAADAISRGKPLYMMYISAKQISSEHNDVKEILKVDLDTRRGGHHDVLEQSPQCNPGRWNHAQTDGPYPEGYARLCTRARQGPERVPTIPP